MEDFKACAAQESKIYENSSANTTQEFPAKLFYGWVAAMSL